MAGLEVYSATDMIGQWTQFNRARGRQTDKTCRCGRSSRTGRKKEVTVMPRGDGTGPQGMGPVTGRAAGYCAGYGIPGYTNPGWGRGFYCRGGYFGRGGGAGTGRGFRWQNWYNATGQPFWARAGQPAWSGPQGQAPQYGSVTSGQGDRKSSYLRHGGISIGERTQADKSSVSRI